MSRLDEAAISAVNFAEVVSTLAAAGGDLAQILADPHDLVAEVVPLDVDLATAVGRLAPFRRGSSLSEPLPSWSAVSGWVRLWLRGEPIGPDPSGPPPGRDHRPPDPAQPVDP